MPKRVALVSQRNICLRGHGSNTSQHFFYFDHVVCGHKLRAADWRRPGIRRACIYCCFICTQSRGDATWRLSLSSLRVFAVTRIISRRYAAAKHMKFHRQSRRCQGALFASCARSHKCVYTGVAGATKFPIPAYWGSCGSDACETSSISGQWRSLRWCAGMLPNLVAILLQAC